MLTKILNQLYEYSNLCIDITFDDKLEMPGFSYIEEDLYGRIKPCIVLNQKLIPRDDNILAHILAHEWGHHFLKHVFINPKSLSKDDAQKKEDEADEYAAGFIQKYLYNTEPIVDFFKRHNPDYQERIKILMNI